MIDGATENTLLLSDAFALLLSFETEGFINICISIIMYYFHVVQDYSMESKV